MAFTFRMFFVDLITFLPEAQDREMRVLLHHLPEDTCDSQCGTIPKHLPGLLFRQECADQEELVEFAKELRWPPTLYQNDPSLGLWRLRNEEVTIRPGGKPARRRLQVVRDKRAYDASGEPVNEVPQSAEEERDFSWMAELDRIVPGTEILTADVLADPPQQVQIGARVKLTDGTLETYRVFRKNGETVTFDFKVLGSDDPATPYRQALAEFALLTLYVQSESVILRARKFKGGASRELELKPLPCSDTVEVVVGSVSAIPQEPCKKSKCCCTADSNPQSVREDEDEPPANHFERQYELCLTRPTLHGRPIPTEVDRKIAGVIREDSQFFESVLAAFRTQTNADGDPSPLLANLAICPGCCGGGTG